MKGIIESKKIYYRILLEQDVVGTYSVILQPNATYVITMVGGGGGMTMTYLDRWNGGWTSLGYSGGSGAMVQNHFKIPQQSPITITIGIGGGGAYRTVANRNQGAASSGEENRGGSTYLSYEGSTLIAAQGGGGGASLNHVGYGGSAIYSNVYKQNYQILDKYTYTLSNNGGYNEYFPGTVYPSVYGARSAYDNSLTGYGAGGGSWGVNSPYYGYSGYCKLIKISEDPESYNYTSLDSTAFLPYNNVNEKYYSIGDNYGN